MTSRFEYIQSNLKSNAQQKTQAGICQKAELNLTRQNNWLTISTLIPGSLELRVWKDAAGTVHLAGGLSVGATVPVIGSGVYLVSTLPPGYRPAGGTVFAYGVMWDASAAGFIVANIAFGADGVMSLFTNGVAPAAGDYFICNAAWVGA